MWLRDLVPAADSNVVKRKSDDALLRRVTMPKVRTRVLPNHEIVTLAVYLLGGDSRHVETEDIAVKANELAPRRFAWRKYPDQINLEVIRVYLSDAKKADKGKFLSGSGTDGWMLTEKGLVFAKRAITAMKGVDLSREPLTARERQWLRNERARLLAEPAYMKLRAGECASRREADAFFRLDEYVTGPSRERKILRVVNSFGDDPDLGGAVKQLAAIVRGEGHG